MNKFLVNPDFSWEFWCNEQVEKCGFTPVPNWPGLFTHAAEKLLLSIYVDDFKMAGPKLAVAKMWKTLSKHLDLESFLTDWFGTSFALSLLPLYFLLMLFFYMFCLSESEP